MIISLVFGLVFLSGAALRYYMQASLTQKAFNLITLGCRDGNLRLHLLLFWAVFILLDLLTLRFNSFAFDVLLFVNNYYSCILIRDREPKDWLPSLMKHAAQSGSV